MSAVLDAEVTADQVESTTVCWDGLAVTSLASSLSRPATDCVERDLIESHSRRSRPRAVCRHLGLVLTTRSAYRCMVARPFIDALADRISLSADVRERAHSALQEAVMNAVLHGNLGLGSALRDDFAGMQNTHERIERLLLTPEVALSAVRIDAIWNSANLLLMVHDCGSGFERKLVPTPEDWMAAGHIGSGRGFQILAAFCDRLALLRGGTVIRLGFHL
jgi:hypothetical protein